MRRLAIATCTGLLALVGAGTASATVRYDPSTQSGFIGRGDAKGERRDRCGLIRRKAHEIAHWNEVVARDCVQVERTRGLDD